MSEKTRPLARIRLPSHHPEVHGMKKGGRVIIHAERADETNDDNPIMPDGMKPKGPQPMPLEHEFHVLKIQKAQREPGEDQKDAVRFLKNRQNGGRAVT